MDSNWTTGMSGGSFVGNNNNNNNNNGPASDFSVNFSLISVTESFAEESENASTESWKTTTSHVISAQDAGIVKTWTTEIYDEFGPPEGIEYIFVPLGVMIFVVVLSAVVLMISRKRKMERLRHRLMPLYNFDPGEEGEEDWETELLEDDFITRPRRPGYQSMDTENKAEEELFSHH